MPVYSKGSVPPSAQQRIVRMGMLVVFLAAACGAPQTQPLLSSPEQASQQPSGRPSTTSYDANAIFRASVGTRTTPDGQTVTLSGAACTAQLIVSRPSTIAISISGSTPTALRDASAWSGTHTDATCTSVWSGGGTDSHLKTFSVGNDDSFADAWLYLTNLTPGVYTIGAGLVGKEIEPSCPCRAVATIHHVHALSTLPAGLVVHGTSRACYAGGPNLTGIRFDAGRVILQYRGIDAQQGAIKGKCS